MATLIRPRRREDFEIAIICALPLEYDAVTLIFDEFWDEDGDRYKRAKMDHNTYTTGRIGNYSVVLTLLPNIGKASAASTAAGLRSSYASLRLAILVGICGGVPNPRNEIEILLGDVVISKQIVQYDLGRQYHGNFAVRDTIYDMSGRPNKDIRSLLATLETEHGLECLQQKTKGYLDQLQQYAKETKRQTRYEYPGADMDMLFAPTYIHRHREPMRCGCSEAIACRGAIIALCEDLGCDIQHLVPRKRLQESPHFRQTKEASIAQGPRIFLGSIGSGDAVIKSANDRDDIASEHDLIAFEMESAGIWDEIPCVVVKGVCDYADSHKNKTWQPFAAAAAASAAKALLALYTQTDRPADSYGSSNAIHTGTRYIETNENMTRFIQALYGVNPDYHYQQSQIYDRAPGTCEWVLEHPRYVSWVSGQSSSLLWITGSPGLGKTVLAKFLTTTLSSSSAGIVCSFYFKSGEASREHANQALCTLLHQLWHKRPDLIPSKVFTDISGKGDHFTSILDDLWTALLETSRAAPDTPIFCIVDGLDECSTASSSRLISHLRATFYLNNSNQSDTKSLNLKFLITSRPTHDIERSFEGFEPIRLRGEDETIAVAKDVQTAISYRITEMRTAKALRPAACKLLEERLSERSNDGSFLLVHLIFEKIDALLQKNRKFVDEVIETAPKDLYQLYESELSASDKMQHRLLQIILAAKRPLTLDEINIAMYIEPTNDNFNDIEIISNIELGVKGLGGILIRVINSRVHLVHETAREYLLNKRITQEALPRQPNGFSDEGHRIMAEACVCFLACENWGSLNLSQEFQESGICFEHQHPQSEHYGKHRGNWYSVAPLVQKSYMDAAEQELLGAGHFFQYAATNWFHHVSENYEKIGCSSQDDTLKPTISRLCSVGVQSKVPWWYFHDDKFFTPTSFHYWAAEGQIAVLEGILRSGTLDINCRIFDHSVLSGAIMYGHDREAFWLIDHLHESSFSWEMVFQEAVENQRSSLVSKLFQRVESSPTLLSTILAESLERPLVHAVQKGATTMVEQLLKLGISPTSKRPFEAAAYNAHPHILDLLLLHASSTRSGPTLDSHFQAALQKAAQEDHDKSLSLGPYCCSENLQDDKVRDRLFESVNSENIALVNSFIRHMRNSLRDSSNDLDYTVFQLPFGKLDYSLFELEQALGRALWSTYHLLSIAEPVFSVATVAALGGPKNEINYGFCRGHMDSIFHRSLAEPETRTGRPAVRMTKDQEHFPTVYRNHATKSFLEHSSWGWDLINQASTGSESTRLRPWQLLEYVFESDPPQKFVPTRPTGHQNYLPNFDDGHRTTKMNLVWFKMQTGVPALVKFARNFIYSNSLTTNELQYFGRCFETHMVTVGTTKNPLISACLFGQEDLAALFIKLGFPVNDSTSLVSPSIASVMSGNVKVVQLLQSYGADMAAQGAYCLPYEHGQLRDFIPPGKISPRKVIHFMAGRSFNSLRQQICLNHVSVTGSPLAFAMALGYEDIIRALVFNRGSQISVMLTEVIASGHSDATLVLLGDGLPPEASSKLLASFLLDAMLQDMVDVSNRLVELGVTLKVLEDPSEVFKYLLIKQDLNLLQNLARLGLDLHIRGPSGQTLLHDAAELGSLNIASWLLSDKNSSSIHGSERETAISHMATGVEDDQVESVCLEDVDFCGRTPLQYAVASGQLSIAKLLLEKKASVFHVDETGRSVLNDLVLSYGKPGIPRLLEDILNRLERSIPPETDSYVLAEDVLAGAIRAGAPNLLDIFMSLGLDVRATVGDGGKLLHSAIRLVGSVSGTEVHGLAVGIFESLVKNSGPPEALVLSALKYCDDILAELTEYSAILEIREHLEKLVLFEDSSMQLDEVEWDDNFWLERDVGSVESGSEVESP